MVSMDQMWLWPSNLSEADKTVDLCESPPIWMEARILLGLKPKYVWYYAGMLFIGLYTVSVNVI